VEPFAAILITHGTLFVGTPVARRAEIRRRRPRVAEGFLERAVSPLPSGEEARYGSEPSKCCKLPHFALTGSLENASSGRKCRTQFNFLLSTGSTAEPLDTTWNPNPG